MTPRWKRLVLPVVLVLGANAAAFAVWTLPRLLQERTLTQRASTLGQELEREKAKLLETRERASLLEQNARDDRQFFDAVVGDRRKLLVPMLQEIVSVAEKHGLAPRSTSYKRAPVTGLPSVTRFDITIPMEGSYAQLAAFVQEMEGSKHFLAVDSVSLAQRRGEDVVSASLDIKLVTYFRAEPDDAGAAP